MSSTAPAKRKKKFKAFTWIKVEDALPAIGEEVLVCDIEGNCFSSSLRSEDRERRTLWRHPFKNIVAWMPLPDPPDLS